MAVINLRLFRRGFFFTDCFLCFHSLEIGLIYTMTMWIQIIKKLYALRLLYYNLTTGQYELRREDPQRSRRQKRRRNSKRRRRPRPSSRRRPRPTSGRRRRPSGQKVCNGRRYNPKYFLCCQNKIVRKRRPSSRCCDKRFFPSSIYVCCGGIMHGPFRPSNGGKYRCCRRSGKVVHQRWSFWC